MQHENGGNVSSVPSDDSSGTLVGELHSRGAIYYHTVDTPSGPRELAYAICDPFFGKPTHTGTDHSATDDDLPAPAAIPSTL